jgi:hypothetical protein
MMSHPRDSGPRLRNKSARPMGVGRAQGLDRQCRGWNQKPYTALTVTRQSRMSSLLSRENS